MLFISVGFMYWLRAVSIWLCSNHQDHAPPDVVHTASVMSPSTPSGHGNAVLAGVAFGIVALGWKGFVVGPAILFLAYALQVALNMFRAVIPRR